MSKGCCRKAPPAARTSSASCRGSPAAARPWKRQPGSTAREPGSGETVKRDRVVVEQAALLGLRAFTDDPPQRLRPLPEAGDLRADRPVAAKHHAGGAELGQDMLDDRREVLWPPRAGLRRNDDA